MTRVQIAGAIVALLVATASLCVSIYHSPDVPFIRREAAAHWITPERPVALETVLGGMEAAPVAAFTDRFDVTGMTAPVTLRVAALGAVAVELNGRSVPLPGEDRACFKRECTAVVGAWLRPGENEIVVRVRNPAGPPLLRLSLERGGIAIATDERWRVSVNGGAPEAVAFADDTRPFAESRELPTPAEALLGHVPLLLAAFAASCAIFVAGRRLLPQAAIRRLPEIALVALSVFWIFLFGAKFVRLPPEVGYDAKFHTEYVRWIVDRGALPLASDGFSMYHPPLFYGLAAGLHAAAGPARDTRAEQAVLKLIPFLSGLGMVFVTWGLMRRLFPLDPRPAFFGVMFAGTLPLNVYMSAYVSNEPLFALLTGLAVLLAASLLLDPDKTPRRLAALAVVLGLALMTKYTAWITVPVIAFFVGFELLLAEGAGLRRSLAVFGSVLLGAVAIGGWVYARNWIHFGDALIWNLDVPGGLPWWQPPGFRTVDYYLDFGESLRHPVFSLFHSFWDAHYAATWGDAAPPSIYHLEERHPLWNQGAMSALYLLALPATALLAAGVVKVLKLALTGDDRRRRAFFTLVAALVFAFFVSVLSVSIRFPFWGGQRASYALAAVVPAAVCSGVGAASFDRWLAAHGRTTLRAVFYGWFGAFAIFIAAAFGS